MEHVGDILKFFSNYPIWAKALMLGGIMVTVATAVLAPRNNSDFEPKQTPDQESKVIPRIILAETSSNEKEWRITEVDATDGKGQPFKISIYILGEDFNWVYESCEVIESNGVEADLSQYLSYKGVVSRFVSAKDIIAVGLASQEAQYPDVEKERAYLRAKYLKLQLEEHVNKEAEFHKLTIGRYVGMQIMAASPSDTAFQRPIIIVVVHEKSDDIDLLAELENVLRKSEKLPISLGDYEEFILDENRQIKHLKTGCRPNAERIRLDFVSAANQSLNRLLDKPGSI